MRTQDEIVARVEATRAGDMFGWQAEVLISGLDHTHAKPWLIAESTPEDWPGPLSEDQQRNNATDYLAFAFEKATDHRGISAARSIDKLGAWLWLLGLDHDRFAAANYTNYGVPQLFVAAEELGVELPTDPDLVRMAEGLPCEDGCEMGCGS